jgi:hypothetical protein
VLHEFKLLRYDAARTESEKTTTMPGIS